MGLIFCMKIMKYHEVRDGNYEISWSGILDDGLLEFGAVVEVGDEGGRADAVDEDEAAEYAPVAEVFDVRIGQVGGADGDQADDGEGAEEYDEDQAAFCAD